jgi:hypothetical protein
VPGEVLALAGARYPRPIDADRLHDLQGILDDVRGWEGIEDRGGGTMYVRRQPFLHFHAGKHGRRADVRGVDGWVEVNLPEPIPPAVRRHLLTVLHDAYAERTSRPRPA